MVTKRDGLGARAIKRDQRGALPRVRLLIMRTGEAMGVVRNGSPADPYPSEPAIRRQHYECQVCGATFAIVDEGDDVAAIPNLQSFLHRHRRCLRRIIERGGTLARPAYRRD